VLTDSGSGLNTRYLTTAAGATYAQTFRWGSFSGRYGRTLGFGSIAGESGRVGSTLLAPLRLVPNDLQGVTLSLHATPIRKIEFSALYTRSIQHLENMVANDFEIIDVSATFHFRKLQSVAGYFLSTQIYSSNLATYPETERGRFYLRIRRKVEFL
jgi:hypothetical protein